ncbi:N-acetyltransferase family protein [Fredinandcohnia sp. 179-A 10B2 NHS]|uniref:GNAT family N-acetyltransferase n=1 Tax=Fredinandcohnia sp. 179-A 10B2 NHS TaxID=3235176 RepID=UPI00399F0F28
MNTTFTAKDHSQVTLRPAQQHDASQIVDAVKGIISSGKYIQKEKARTATEEEQFISEMNAKENMYTVAECEGKVVGIARVIRGEISMKRHTGLFRTWLIDEVQGLGIGKKIMEYTIKWCETHQLHKLCLTVFASNEPAFQLYKKYGFVEEGRQKDQVLIDGVFDDEIFMAYFFNHKFTSE